VVVIPAPAYPVYTGDMGIKCGLDRYDLQTHFNIEETGSTAPLTVFHLEKAEKEIKAQGKRFRLLVITSPDNPTGCVYGEKQLRDLADWCISHDIHMIVNEIYALSRIDTADNLIRTDYTEEVPFSPFAGIMNRLGNDHLHLWYGLSKDFAMSGLRFGIVHSMNKEFMTAIRNVNIPHMVSNHTQWMIGELFKRDTFIRDYIEENRNQVTSSYKIVVTTLKRLGIPYIPARGSLFVWADLSAYLSEETDKGQEALWLSIYQNTGVLLTPGAGFGHRKKGLFRIVHTAIPTSHLSVAMERLENFLGTPAIGPGHG
jgi:aspartate/methionine/tyrosine aminotransferase